MTTKKKQRKVVLVVEDERPLVEAIQLKLDRKGFDSVAAKSVKQAIEYVHELPHIDALWVDHYLFGDKDGLSFLEHVRAHDSTLRAPIFVVTNSVSPDKEQRYQELGAVNYYVKADHRLDDIIQGIKTYLEKDE